VTVLAVVLLIGLLIVLISWGRLPPFAAFILVAFVGALVFRMPLESIPGALEHGVGDMLGSLTAVVCLGAMFGRIIAGSGAAQTISRALVDAVGPRFILLAMAATGLIVGIPLFYLVGFVVMTPLIFSLAQRSGLPVIYLGIPLLCGLSVAHGFLPPHPSPVALIRLFGADTGLTLVYGLVIGVAALLAAGPLLALILRPLALRTAAATAASPFAAAMPDRPADELPGALNSFLAALLPVLLMGGATAVAHAPTAGPDLKALAGFIGQPMVVLTISLLYATLSLGLGRGTPLKTLMQGYGESLKEISGVLLILAGAGALKQVFVDSGVSAALGAWLSSLPLHPLVLGWLIAVVIRVALGSATIAGLTAAGLLAPLVAASHVDPNLMVLAVGAGSLMCSHVNDPGFWLYKEYFNLDLKDTFRSWTVMESVAGLVGLAGVLTLNAVLPYLR
jgi:Gnt-I system high-affinity gluconate transporter